MNYEDVDVTSAEIQCSEVSREDGKKCTGRGSSRRVGDYNPRYLVDRGGMIHE